MNVGADLPRAGRRACSPPSAWTLGRRHRAPTPSRARSSSPAPPCSGCATGSASSTDAAEIGPLAAVGRRHRRRVPRARPSPASAARGGTRTPAARSSASPGAPAGPTSPGPWSRRWPSRPATWSTAMAAASGHAVARAAGRRRRVGHGPAAAAPGRPAPGARVAGPSIQETTALGAAYLAGLAEGCGLASTTSPPWHLDAEFEPAATARGRRRLRPLAPGRRALPRAWAAGRAGASRS